MGEIDETSTTSACASSRRATTRRSPITLDRELPLTGNGGHEVRSWVIAHSAAGSRGFELIAYEPVPEVYVGCGYASWKVAA